MNTYYLYHMETLELVGSCECSQWNASRHSFLSDAVEVLAAKDGFAVCVVLQEGVVTGTEYQEDHRGATIYDQTDCTVSKTVKTLGAIESGWTQAAPITEYDVWANGMWNTDIGAQYIAQYNAVDSTRRTLYAKNVDPLELEAARLTRTGDTDGAKSLYSRIDEWVKKIKTENPWPENPTTE
jgi:hypothetical protein